jgi:hypothetical protein
MFPDMQRATDVENNGIVMVIAVHAATRLQLLLHRLSNEEWR